MRSLFFAIVFFHCCITFGQIAHVEKEGDGDSSYLRIVINYKDSSRSYFANCNFKSVTLLPDTVKINLIKQLVTYFDDTGRSVVPVRMLSNYYVKAQTPSSKTYNVQIAALILINYIAFSSDAFTYSPYPVLVDKNRNQEVHSAGKDLNDIVAVYKNWVSNLVKSGFVNYSFPLLGGRYEWFGCITFQDVFKRYPKWNDHYSCRQLSEVL